MTGTSTPRPDGFHPLFRRLNHVREVSLEDITVGKRERPIDKDKVEQLARSIKVQGLLQPIGLKREEDGYRLIYGAHRLAAVALLAASGVIDGMLPCVVYPRETAEWECRAAEIAENLFRKELSPKERDAHTVLYLGLLKQGGAVAEAPAVRGNRKSKPNGSVLIPTATRQAAADLGVSDDTVRNRVRNSVELAVRAGIAVARATPEAMTAEELEMVGQAALQQAEADKLTARPRAQAKGNSTPPTTFDKPLPDAITITPKASSKDIAAALVGAGFPVGKLETVARLLLVEVRRRKSIAKQTADDLDQREAAGQ